MKRAIILSLCAAAALWCGIAAAGNEDDGALASRITAVKLYQNQAAITRTAKLRLKQGMNRIVMGGLPPLLQDWSVRGSLPRGSAGSIVSLEVVQKALVQKKRKEILDIEEKLKALRDRDQSHLDDLKIVQSQEKFLDSIVDFTNQAVSKELMTRIPEVKVWDGTLTYTAEKRKSLLARKRGIERERETIGKEIQKWEFELSQIAGTSYFDTYRTLNDSILTNRSALQIQQFTNITDRYAARKRILENPTENVDVEKRLAVEIDASSAGDVDFGFSYVIPNTAWEMKYDVRADSVEGRIALFVYGNIYQMTGENWEDIALSLSTGAPVSAISPPGLNPWYLDVIVPYNGYAEGEKADREEDAISGSKAMKKEMGGKARPLLPEPEIREGALFRDQLPGAADISNPRSTRRIHPRVRPERDRAPLLLRGDSVRRAERLSQGRGQEYDRPALAPGRGADVPGQRVHGQGGHAAGVSGHEGGGHPGHGVAHRHAQGACEKVRGAGRDPGRQAAAHLPVQAHRGEPASARHRRVRVRRAPQLAQPKDRCQDRGALAPVHERRGVREVDALRAGDPQVEGQPCRGCEDGNHVRRGDLV